MNFRIYLYVIFLISGSIYPKVANAETWPFKDKKNVATFTVAEIAEGKSPIIYVYHDLDETWQFHPGDDIDSDKPKLLSLEEIVKLDPSVKELADLPTGWMATRKSKNDKWVRSKNEEAE